MDFPNRSAGMVPYAMAFAAPFHPEFVLFHVTDFRHPRGRESGRNRIESRQQQIASEPVRRFGRGHAPGVTRCAAPVQPRALQYAILAFNPADPL